MVVNGNVMCVCREFREELKMLETNKQFQKEEVLIGELEGMYQSYIEKDRHFFHFSGKSDVLAFFPDSSEGLQKAEMLALLLYQDALVQKDVPAKKDLLEKSWLLYQYVCAMANDFSFDKARIIKRIEQLWME